MKIQFDSVCQFEKNKYLGYTLLFCEKAPKTNNIDELRFYLLKRKGLNEFIK